MNLQDANKLILERISKSVDERTILGFLPLSIEKEDLLIKTVRENLNDFNVFGRLRTHPACVAYFLAVSASRQCTNGREFWPKLTDFTGLDLHPSDREKLANKFRSACESMDLLTGTVDDTHWKHVAPFLFQAGILNRWTKNIAGGLRVVLKKRQAPDLNSEEEVRHFIDLLCDNSHLNGMENLKHTLQSAVGPLLIRSLIRAYHYSNWKVIPAHLREPIRNAFNEVGQAAFPRPPFLQYNPAFNETEIILPDQNKQVANSGTKWEFNGRRYCALYETVIRCNPDEGKEVTASLTGQNQNFDDRSYNLKVGYSDNRPFRVFNRKTGREKRLPETENIAISPDDYLVVMRKDVSAGEDEPLTEETDLYKTLELSVRPGEEPLHLEHSGRNWTITSILRTGFYTNHDESNSIQLEGQEEQLLYGNCYGIVGYFPKPTDDAQVLLNIQCPEQGLSLCEEVTTSATYTTDVIQYKENIDALINKLKAELPYGIHHICLRLTRSNKSILKEFWLWNGLRQISDFNGFEYDSFPQNLDTKRSEGIVCDNNTIRFDPDNLRPFTSLKLTQPNRTLRIPRPGVQALLGIPGYGPDPISRDALIVVKKGDKRTIHLKSGGFECWEIYSGNQLLVTLDRKRTKHIFSLAGLASEIGHSGIISAKDRHGHSHKLAAFSLPLTASPPCIKTDHVNRIDEWSFKVATEGLYSLGVSIADISNKPVLNFSTINEFIQDNEGIYTSQPLTFENGCISLLAAHQLPRESVDSDHSRIKVSLSFDIDKLGDQLFVIDFHRKTSPVGEWLPLQCDERQRNGTYNYSDIRFFAWGDKRFDENSNYWQKLRRATRAENSPEFVESLQAASVQDVDHTLKLITQLLAFKYPSSVWDENAHRIENFAKHICDHRFSVYDETAGLWWRHSASELALYAKQSHTPIIRSFLLSTEASILRTPRSSLLSYAVEGPTLVDSCMMLPAKLRNAGSKVQFLRDLGDQINGVIPLAYKNCMSVQTGKEPELKGFSLSGFLQTGGDGYSPLTDKIQERAKDRLPRASFPLFSPEHLLFCIKMLNVRCRKIQEAVDAEEQLPLQEVAQSIQKADQQIHSVAPRIAPEIGWTGHESHLWTPPLLKNDVAVKVARLAWTLAAIARLAANNKLSPHQFNSHLEKLLCRNQPCAEKIHSRLNIILSQAPELFSCYMALFELSIDLEK